MNLNQNNLSYYLNLRNLSGLRSVAPSIRYIDGEEQSEVYAVHVNENIYLWGCEMAPLSGDCISIEYKPVGGARFEEVKSPVYQDKYKVVIDNNSKKIYGSPNLPYEISKNPDYYSSYFGDELVIKEITPPGSNDAENLFVKFGESSPIEVIRQNFVRCFRFLKTGYYKIILDESYSSLYRQVNNEHPISNPDYQVNYEEYLANSSGPWIASDGLNDDYKKVLRKTIIVNCVDNFDIITDSNYKNLDFDIDSQANYDALYLDSTSKVVNGFDVIISGKKYEDSIFNDSKYLIGLDNTIANEFVLSKSDKVLSPYSKNITYNFRNKKFEGIRFHGPAHFVELLKITSNENGYALVDLRGCVFSNCTFSGVSFGTQYIDYLILDGCSFSGCTFHECEFYCSPQNISFVQCQIVGSKNSSGFFNFSKSSGNIIIGCNFVNVVDPIKFTNFSYTTSQINEEHGHKNNIIVFNSVSRNNFINSSSSFISVNGENSLNYLSSFSGNMVMSNYVSDSMGSFFSIRSASAYANLISNNVSSSSGEIIIGVDEIVNTQDQSIIANRAAQNGNYIQKFPPIGAQAVDWFQSSNYGIQSQFSGFDIVLWYSTIVYKIPGATTAYPPPSATFSQCSVCTLGSMGCDYGWDDAYNFYRRFQYNFGVPCGTGTPTTLQEVRNEFRSYFDIDAIVKSQSRYNPDWILAFLHGSSEPLWYPTSIPGLNQWAILADDGLTSSSIGLAFNPLQEYVNASNKYKQRIMAYFYPKAWIELDPAKYPFAINMIGQKISSARHGNDTSERSIFSSNFVKLLGDIHVELAQKGMDRNTGYGVVGAMWDALLLEYQLDFSDTAKAASGIDVSVDFPWPVSPSSGPIYNFVISSTSNGNVQTLLLKDVNESLGWTAAIKNKLQAYVYALIAAEKQAVASIRNALDQAGYPDFVLLQAGSNSQSSFELPSNGEAALVHESGMKIEIGPEGYRYRRQPNNIINISQRDAVPDFWLAQHFDMLLQQGAAGKRQYAWQLHLGPVYFSYGGTCGSQMYSCITAFDAQYPGTIEFKNYMFPREMAVRGWLENQSLLSLASYCSPEFMHNYNDWHKFDNPDNLLGFENNDGQFAIQHLPYMRRIYSILGSIKESNVYLSQRGSVAWCVILHKPELGRKSTLYNGYPGSVYGSYYWPIMGAVHTCVENGVPHVIVHESAFTANRFSNTGIIIVPFNKSDLSSTALNELNQFAGMVIYMQSEFLTGVLTNNFHNTSLNGSITYAKFSRNMLWDFMLGAVRQPYVKANCTIPDNSYEDPVPLTGYEHGYDIFGNESMIITMAADVSWHDPRKAYLFDQTYNNDPTQGVDYCGRQNLLFINPNSTIRVEEAATSLGLRKILDNCGECSNRDCFYVDYSGSDPIPETAIPARGKLVYYAGYPPTWDSLRKSNLVFNSDQQPCRVRQLLLNKESGRFDPIDYFVNSDNFDVIPYEIGSILQVQFKNSRAINSDLGICISSSLFKAKNHLQISALFLSIASNNNAINLVRVKLKCGNNVIEIDVAGNIVFNELSNHAFNNPSVYEWISDDPCGFAAPSDCAPIGFMFADSNSCPSGSLSVSGIVIQNEGICNIALSIPSLRADALSISEIPCACGSERPSKFYSSRALISADYTPQDGSLWAAQLDQEIANSASSIDGLLLFIKPDTDPSSRYYNVDSSGLPFYKGIINYLDDIGASIIEYTNGAKSIYDYYYGLVLDFSSNFDINENAPHPRYCAYPNAISILSQESLANTQREIANINGAYIDLIREIKFAYSEMRVSIRGIGQFGNGLSLEANVDDPNEYSLLDAVPEVRIGLNQRVSESYGPLIEKCDFIYVQNENTIRGDSYNIAVIRTSVMIGAIRNHFGYVNGSCPELYVEVNGLYTGSQDAQNENYCEINSDEIVIESVSSLYKYGVNGFVYNAVQETLFKQVFGNCPISVNDNEYYQKLINCWTSQPEPYLQINYSYLLLNMYRCMTLSGKTSVYLGGFDDNIATIRREFPYIISSYQYTVLKNASKSTFTFSIDAGTIGFAADEPSLSAHGFDLNYPCGADFEVIDEMEIPIWSQSPSLLDINKGYLFFLNDPYPNDTFENKLLDGSSSAFQAKPIYYKYAVYDELNNVLVDRVENKVSITGFDFCAYINENNKLNFKMMGRVQQFPFITLDKHFGKCYFVNFELPLMICASAIQNYLDYVSVSFQGSNYGDYAYFNDFIDINSIKINSFTYLSYHAINTGRDIPVPYIDMKASLPSDQFLNYIVSNNTFTTNYPRYQAFNSVEYVDSVPVSLQNTNFENYHNYINSYISSLPITSDSNFFNTFNPNNNNLLIIGNPYDVVGESGFRNYIINKDELRSIKCRSNCFVTLNMEGSIAIAYCPLGGSQYANFRYYNALMGMLLEFDTLFNIADGEIIFYDKNELENNFWVDENGLVSYLENKDFIDFEIYGSHIVNFYPSLTYIYALHKNGKLYARELNSSISYSYSDRLICKLSVADSLVGGPVGLDSISEGDQFFVTAHDPRNLQGQARNYLEEDNTARWEVIAIDYSLGYVVLQCDDAYTGPPEYAGENLNPKRPFKIYKYDVLRKVGSFNDFTVTNKYFEDSWYLLGRLDVPTPPIIEQDENLPEDMTLAFRRAVVRTRMKKIEPLSSDGVSLNPKFMTLSLDPFSLNNYGLTRRPDVCVAEWVGDRDVVFTSDPHKKIFLWQDEKRVVENFFLAPMYYSANRILRCAQPRVNGVLYSLQMSLQQIGKNNKVLKILSNNSTQEDVYYGVAPIFVLKTNEQNNQQFSNEEGVFYSYSYELCIFDPIAIWNDTIADFSKFSILNKYKKEKVFGYMADGYYSQIGWKIVDNPDFNQNFYDNFIQKPVYAGMTAPEGFDKYYCPIRCGSTGLKSLVLLNNDGDCCVINSHTAQWDPENRNNINFTFRNAIRGFNDYNIENQYIDLRPFKQYWLYNRGSGYPQKTDQIPYGGVVDFHTIPFVHRNVYKNANDPTSYDTPYVYEIPDNSLVSPIVHENIIYGLGNPPSDLNHPFGIGMDSQQLTEFKTFSYTGESSIHDSSKDSHYIEVISHLDFEDDGLMTGKDAIIFRVKKDSGFKIDLAKVEDYKLTIYYSNGVFDSANMGTTYYSHPITFEAKTYYGSRKTYDYWITRFWWFIIRDTIVGVIPAFLRKSLQV